MVTSCEVATMSLSDPNNQKGLFLVSAIPPESFSELLAVSVVNWRSFDSLCFPRDAAFPRVDKL